MTGNHTPPGPDVRALPGAPRATRIARPDRTSNLTASGYGYYQITKMARTSLSTTRREIGRTLARGPLGRFARMQVARLVKALRLAEAAMNSPN